MKKTVLILSLLMLAASVSGCSSLLQGVDAYGAAAITGAQATNDTLITANKVALCATPVSALVRHPELVTAVRSLCLPAKDTGNVSQVIDAIEATQPAAKS
jgi:hypothetical protein